MGGRVTVACASSLADPLYVVPHSPRNDRPPVGVGAVRQATGVERVVEHAAHCVQPEPGLGRDFAIGEARTCELEHLAYGVELLGDRFEELPLISPEAERGPASWVALLGALARIALAYSSGQPARVALGVGGFGHELVPVALTAGQDLFVAEPDGNAGRV